MEISISYDTKTKKKKVLWGGKELKNVAQVMFYNYGDEEDRMEITCMTGDEENGVYTRTCIYADENKASFTDTFTKKNIDLSKLSDNLKKQLRII